jgi:hypothetical protein
VAPPAQAHQEVDFHPVVAVDESAIDAIDFGEEAVTVDVPDHHATSLNTEPPASWHRDGHTNARRGTQKVAVGA